MAQSIQISDDIWQELDRIARRKRRQPQTILAQLIRDFLETESDQALFDEMKMSLKGREISDDEAVGLVHLVRQERRS